ncbi:MAG TPA: hypothetical protein VF258_04905, partial [Luteolibacter sp.]
MKNLLVAIPAFLAITVGATAAPRLVVSTPSLVPESQIDLVLDSPVVATTELGKNVDNTWLEIQPALPGKLVWKAQNIAQLVPDQAPAIGTTYTFSIPKNREYLDKSAIPAGKFATLSSEPFRITAANPHNRWTPSYSPSTASWLIVFNDAIDPATAANYISFSSKSGQRVAARLERATVAQAGYYRGSYKPWAARFRNAPVAETIPDSPVPNILLATPVSPLPVGEGWIVSALKGIPNESSSASTQEDNTYQIGEVKPFRIADISSYQTPGEPRKILVNFNQPVTKSLPADFLEKCIVISPRPENLSVEAINETQMTLTGDFADVDKCSVTFRPPYTSASGLNLEAAVTKKITFGHFIPVLSFPSQDQAQLAHGSRKYRMLTLNLESTRLRIKKLSGPNLIRAFQGYRHVTGNGHDGDSISPTITLPYSLIVGESVADLEIPHQTPIDTTKITTLDWNEILPKTHRFGTFFVEAAGKSHPDYDGKGTDPTTQAVIQLT